MTLIEQLILLENREFTVLNEWDVFNTLELINTVVQRSLSMSNAMFEPKLGSRLIQMNVKLRELLDFGLLEPYHSVSTTFLYSGCSQVCHYIFSEFRIIDLRFIYFYDTNYCVSNCVKSSEMNRNLQKLMPVMYYRSFLSRWCVFFFYKI